MSEANAEQRGTRPYGWRWSKKRIAVAAILVAVAVVAASVIAWLAAPATPLRVTVSLSPATPRPNEPLTVTAQVEGGGPLSPIEVLISYQAYVNGSEGGGGSPVRSGNRWSDELPGFPDGTEVWITVAVATANQAPVIEHRTVSIGNVLHGGPSGLVIDNVVRSPEQPDSLDTVRIYAQLRSAANITNVYVLARHFLWKFEAFGTGSSEGGGGNPMIEGTSGNYSTALGFPGPGAGGGGFQRGTIWVYRIVAWDETGNTAATEIETFTVR